MARNFAVLCWHLLTKDEDYLWVRPALVAHKARDMHLQAGHPQRKGNQRGPTYAYSVKALRHQEMRIAEQAERNYARFVARWKTRPPMRRATQSGKKGMRHPAAPPPSASSIAFSVSSTLPCTIRSRCLAPARRRSGSHCRARSLCYPLPWWLLVELASSVVSQRQLNQSGSHRPTCER